MTIPVMQYILLWSLVFNCAILLIWFFVFAVAHRFLYNYHSLWFKLSPETFDALHYLGLCIYAIGILIFNAAPLIAFAVGLPQSG